MKGVRRWSVGLGFLAAASLVLSFWMIFFYAPTEREMGIVQRIFYVHVPSAWVAFLAFGIVALCSLGYLWLRDERLDTVAVCAAEDRSTRSEASPAPDRGVRPPGGRRGRPTSQAGRCPAPHARGRRGRPGAAHADRAREGVR